MSEVEAGEYLAIEAERGGHKHRIALFFASAPQDAIYRALAGTAEHIFVRGTAVQLDSSVHGIETPISSADAFHQVLVEWNNASASGKFAPAATTAPIKAHPPTHRTLLSEAPIEAIWLRLRQLTSVSLAEKLVQSRADTDGIGLDSDARRTKAEGLAFALRNAGDYFRMRESQNVSQRVLSLYYGTMSFAFAEMLASPTGPTNLAAIEEGTKRGHGLCTVDGKKDGLEHIVVSPIATGFYSTWLQFLGTSTDAFPKQKPKVYDDLKNQPTINWLTIEQLFARIPEISDLYLDIFESKPAWVTPLYDSSANPPLSSRKGAAHQTTTYAIFLDDSARLTSSDIAEFPGPISEIAEVPSKDPGRHFRVAVDVTGKTIWWDALPIHRSPFERNAVIVPAFGVAGEYRAICFALLYALSIVVRYRPSVWRRVQEGELDHLRVLIEAYLAVVERVLPQDFLQSISAQPVFAKQPGSLW